MRQGCDIDVDEIELGDWTDWLAEGITAVTLGTIVGVLFGWQIERTGVAQSCVIWILVFAAIGFRKQIRYFIYLLLKHTTGR
jgi:hypothetical protein